MYIKYLELLLAYYPLKPFENPKIDPVPGISTT